MQKLLRRLNNWDVVKPLVNLLESYNISRWMGKGFWAVLDKGLYGASNFILNILLARWITEQGYGAFTVAFSSFVLLLAFYIALFTEPMLVFGPGRYENRFADYIGVLTHGHLAFTLLTMMVLLGTCSVLWTMNSSLLAAAFLGLALALPLILFAWLMRQACYVPNNPRLAAMSGGIYMLTTFVGTSLVYKYGWLTPFSIFCIMGGAGLLSGLFIAYRLDIPWLGFRTNRFRVDVFKRHWDYGRWAAATRIPMRAPGSLILMVLPIWGGLAAAGTLKALMNLVQPMLQMTAALTILLIPRLSRVRDQPQMFTLTRIMLGVFVGGGTLYWLIVSGFARPIIDLLYDGQYVEFAHLLWILALQTVLTAAIEIFSAALRAHERPDWIFWAYTISASVGLPLSFVLIAVTGLLGAIVGTISIYTATLCAMFYYYRKLKRQQISDQTSSSSVEKYVKA